MPTRFWGVINIAAAANAANAAARAAADVMGSPAALKAVKILGGISLPSSFAFFHDLMSLKAWGTLAEIGQSYNNENSGFPALAPMRKGRFRPLRAHFQISPTEELGAETPSEIEDERVGVVFL
jgi:hypothetical protein